MEVSGAISIISGRRSFNSKFGPKSDFQRQSLGSDLTRFSGMINWSIGNDSHKNFRENVQDLYFANLGKKLIYYKYL